MSKIMSMLEKLNVIEKVNEEKDNITQSNVKEHKNDGPKVEHKNTVVEYTEPKEVIEPKVQKSKVDISPKAIQADTSFEKNLTIDEVYKMYNMENGQVNTIFMLGNFLNALPENLPYDVKKSTVLNIIGAASADLNQLLSDGEKRLAALNQFSNEYYNSINEDVTEYKTEIMRLKKMIESYEVQIQRKETILSEQNHIIKYEAQRINKIVDFFNND